MKLQICGIAIPVLRARPSTCAALRDSDGAALCGVFDPSEGAIYLAEGQSASLERDTLNHEAMHALLHYSGAKAFLSGELRDASRAEQVEETLVRIITPHVPAIRWAK